MACEGAWLYRGRCLVTYWENDEAGKTNTDKLQRLQNRAPRLCYDVIDPKTVSIKDLHTRARLNYLGERCEMHLLNLMYDLNASDTYIKPVTADTRQGDKSVFSTGIVHYEFYRRSPYYAGAALWNKLTIDVQQLATKTNFKSRIRALYQ